MTNIILITGATSGFGKAIAEKFAAAKWNCIITGRRAEKLNVFAEELQIKYGIQTLPLVFDVQNREQVFSETKGPTKPDLGLCCTQPCLLSSLFILRNTNSKP